MSPLTASDILRVWELGQGRHPVDRALLFLTFAYPEKTHEELAGLRIGQRDAYLLALYQRTFGATLNGCVACPQCVERLEFSVLVSDLLGTPPSSQDEQEHTLKTHEIEVRFRALNSWDIAAVAPCENTAAARRLLAQRCVLRAVVGGKVTPPAELPDEILSSLAQCLADCDPRAELLFDLACQVCGHQWTALFDIESFLWAEICTQAQRLFHEVHMLAQAYGWHESDILSMSTSRLWKWPPSEPHLGGALANTPGTNIAYMQSSYQKGVDVLSGFLMHELVHNCGAGAGGDPRHRQADVARVYCMGPGKNEVTPKVAVDLDKNVNLIFSYRRLVREWLSGRLQLTVGADIGVTGLLRLGQTGQQATPAELVSGTLGARRRFNIWGAERFGGLVLSADLGVGLDRFKVRAPTPNDKPSHAVGPGVVLQLGARVEFWIPSVTFKEGRVTPLHFDVGVQLAEPLTPDAERLHSFIFGIGGAF